MRQCPKCGKWTMDFDEYFSRFRCYNARCSWMPSSVAERRLRLLHERKCPKEINSFFVNELQLKVTASYDEVNDVLIFDFNKNEPSFEFPDDDVRVQWMIGRHTGQLLGLVILGAREFGISEVQINVAADIEKAAQTINGNTFVISQGKPTRLAVENTAVTLRTSRNIESKEASRLSDLLDFIRESSAECIGA